MGKGRRVLICGPGQRVGSWSELPPATCLGTARAESGHSIRLTSWPSMVLLWFFFLVCTPIKKVVLANALKPCLFTFK